MNKNTYKTRTKLVNFSFFFPQRKHFLRNKSEDPTPNFHSLTPYLFLSPLFFFTPLLLPMDLLRILDAKPEPQIVNNDHFKIDLKYQNSNIYKIATPMSDFQKELIDQIVSLHYSDILRFFETDANDPIDDNHREIIISSLNTLIKNLKLVCLHPYLLINHFFPKSLTTRDLPNRLAETSGKFEILNNLLIQLDLIYNPIDKSDHSKSKEINVAIVIESGKPMDLIDALCIGHRCNIKLYNGIKLRDSSANNKKNMNLNLNVHLFPTDFQNLNDKEINNNLKNFTKKMDFIILFDLNIDLNNPIFNKLINSSFTKIFKLVPINSVEHIELYYEDQIKSMGLNQCLKPITSAIVVLRDRVGKLPSNLKPAYNKNLLYLKDYLSNPTFVKWPLPDLPIIGNFTSRDVEKSLLTEVKFNFDNEEILKEEESNKLQFQDTLNTNFGGKTKMIGHIIQPRFSKKNSKFKNYYDSKRLEKNYFMNPLNRDYENLTGISKEIKSHDVLTHTSIHQFNLNIMKTIDMNEEVKSFNEFNNIRLNDFNVMIDAYTKLSNDKSIKESKLNNVDIQINENNNKLEDFKNQIKEYNDKIENVSKSSSVNKDYVLKDIEKFQILEEISKLEQKLESVKNENKYMNEEIKRAEISIQDSQSQISQTKQLNENLLNKIEALKSEDSEINKELQSLNTLNEQFNTIQKQSTQLKQKLESTLITVSEIGHRSRHVNYRNKG